MDLANNIGGKALPPLSAVRRKKKGPNREPPGSIATAQAEVDAIVRGAYAKVYKGNMANIEEATNKYLEEYSHLIYCERKLTSHPWQANILKRWQRTPMNQRVGQTSGRRVTSSS